MTRRHSSLIDRVGRDVVNRDFHRRVEEHVATATEHAVLLKNLLWILEQVADDELPRSTRHTLGDLLNIVRSRELLALLVEDSPLRSVLDKYCRCCVRNLEKLERRRRGRRREYCETSCKQRAYRRRRNPESVTREHSKYYLEMAASTIHHAVEQMEQADSKLLQKRILTEKIRELRQPHTPVARAKRETVSPEDRNPTSVAPQPLPRASWWTASSR